MYDSGAVQCARSSRSSRDRVLRRVRVRHLPPLRRLQKRPLVEVRPRPRRHGPDVRVVPALRLQLRQKTLVDDVQDLAKLRAVRRVHAIPGVLQETLQRRR